ncbi:hypothetical protein [Bacteroides sp. UBA939]|uniref:hypothetical protein n=1 Tax=Bacteroides sp. UBA939 TaxID=1946092 RepID=UPI0025C034BD|nr:hypothetical protein [Bacteroides sp. UBA939]
MKLYTIKKYAAVLLCLAAFTSCDTDAEGTKYDVSGVEAAFASTQMNAELSAEDNGVLRVPVYRGNTGAEASVGISVDEATTEEGIFTLSSSTIAFAQGNAVGYAELRFSMDDLSATDKYTIVLTIDDENALSPAQCGEITVSAQRKLTWENYGTGIYTSQLFGDAWEQPIQKAKEGNIYRLPDCIMEGYPFVFTLSDDNQKLVNWGLQPTGYRDATYGMMYYSPTGMERQGNALLFAMRGLVAVPGGYAALYSGFTEVLELPE